MDDRVIRALADGEVGLDTAAIRDVVERACPPRLWAGKRVLLVIPDSTRTAPVGAVFQVLHACLAGAVKRLDILVALGTHQPMSEQAICARLEITLEQRRRAYGSVEFHNHSWDDPQSLKHLGCIPAGEIHELSGGLFTMDVPVEINRLIFEYDQLILLGPVFPHEVVGFSGGNKYLFPGISGPAVLNFFHWLGAVITTPRIIGNVWTPVRRVIDRAASLVNVSKLGVSMVVDPDGSLRGLFAGQPESAWEAAVALSQQRHVTTKERPFRTVLSCCPPMYDELWTGGKCMYKLEPVLADGGELIIYAPHIREVSFTHGVWLDRVGYHCRDYFLRQWDQFKHVPWGVLAHSVHVHGLGTYEAGVERPRARVVLATGIPEERCQRINLGYRDPASIRPADYAGREAESVLLVPKAGEMLYRLEDPPAWAR
jgi:nickel-dependent lactate racemase